LKARGAGAPGAHAATSGATHDEPPPPEVVPSPQARDAERRHLTVMFCDLVGSSGLAAQMDPEDFTRLLGEFYDASRLGIEAFDGKVGKLLGTN
jgi:class 3 adenylate cyclase